MKLLPTWEKVLSSAARFKEILPGAVLVGATASALYARHRFPRDAGPFISNLQTHFDEVLAQLQSVAGWKTARVGASFRFSAALTGSK